MVFRKSNTIVLTTFCQVLKQGQTIKLEMFESYHYEMKLLSSSEFVYLKKES